MRSILSKIESLTGYEVRSGIVDLHGDGFERHLAPRRGAVQDLTEGLFAADAELAANGITTAVLAQFWSWEGGMRGPDFARRVIETVTQNQGRLRTRMVVQLRVETHLVDEYPEIEEMVIRHKVPFVVWNDHLPHAALAAGKRPPRLTGQALKSGRSPEAHLAYLQGLHAQGPRVRAALMQLAGRFAAHGVRMGSHDDATAEERAFFSGIGAHLAEFPETEAALDAACAAGTPVVLGAPNAVRGASHKGNLSARDAVLAGKCDALVSDYHYPSLRLSALSLTDALGTEAAWSLISDNPAGILGISQAQRAQDATVLDGQGRIAGTMVGGRWSYLTGDLADHVTQP